MRCYGRRRQFFQEAEDFNSMQEAAACQFFNNQGVSEHLSSGKARGQR